jgi:hypothetical protein
MRFPLGVTGLGPPHDSSSPSLRQFRADCWQVARALDAKVEDLEPNAISNFESQALVRPDLSVVILLNKFVPIVGLCKPFEFGTVVFEYIDHKKVADGFLKTGRYEVWTRERLELLVKDEMWEGLLESEQRHLKYWRKYQNGMRVGDLVFNHWD